MELSTNAPVLVTGASGFIAGHVINQLLIKGYKVKATVRSKETAAFDHLFKLPNAEKNLQIIEADLTKYTTWDEAFSGGVEYVFHVAAPYILKPENPETTLVMPIVAGTQNILEMCQRTESVKKLIFTSCMSTLTDDFNNAKEYDENDWNTTSSLTRNSYAYAKTMAEMAVINFTARADCTFKCASILPFVCIGPPLGSKLSFSHKFLLSFLNKQIRVILDISYNISDVRDVAMAQVLAMEREDVVGRYCFCNDPVHLSTVLQIIHEAFHDMELPTKKVRNFTVKLLTRSDTSFRGEYMEYTLGKVPLINCNKAMNAGMTLRPPVQTIIDTVRYFIENRCLELPIEARPVSCSVM